MPASIVLFVLVCGIGTLNSVFLASYLWVHRRGDRALNRLLSALLLTFTLRVSKAVTVFFVSQVHWLFELLWIGVLGATGVIALLYVCRLAGAAVFNRGTTYGPSGMNATQGSAWRAMLSAMAASSDGIISTPVILCSSASSPRSAVPFPDAPSSCSLDRRRRRELREPAAPDRRGLSVRTIQARGRRSAGGP